jgi:predicted ATPase
MIDVRQFLAGVEQAETRDELTAAIAWYRGPLLPACDDEWLVADRYHLHQHWLGGLMRLSRLYEAAQQYDQAIAAAEQVRQNAPLDERHYQRLMRLHMKVGHQSAALHIYQTCVEMLAREFDAPPSSETQALHAQLRHPPLASSPGVRLPIQPTAFVGRANELHALHQLLDQPACRLLTILGTGGVGKTRLALAVAEQRCTSYPHGVMFVSLAAAHSADDVLWAMSEALGLTPQGQTPLWDFLVAYLQPREVLLLIDACEHVPDAAILLSNLLAAAPGLTLLVTSREALRVQWEQRFPLEGLALTPITTAPDDEDVPDAMMLFYERIRRVQPQFTPTPEDITAIITICQAVSELPLGIEIAAALFAQMNCTAIAEMLQQQRLSVETTLRDVPSVQRSLYATTAASWQRMTSEEQRSYRCLTPFRGSFSAAAARAVAAAAPEHLQRFVDTSLLRQIASDRYQFHDVLHEFATLQLIDPLERATAHAAHSAYHLNLLQQQQAHLHGSSPRSGLDIIQENYSDIRAAWQWAVEHQEWDMLLCGVQALGDFYTFRAWIQIGYEHFQSTLVALETAVQTCPSPIRALWCLAARVAYRVAWLCVFRGDLAAAQEIIARGMHHAEAIAAPWELALTRYFLGHVLVWRGQIESALPHLAAARLGFEQQADGWYLSMVIATYGEIALLQHHYAQAQHHYTQALVCVKELGSILTQGTHLLLLGRAFVMDGKLSEAHDAYTRGLAIAREMDDYMVEASCLVGLGGVAMFQEQVDDAWYFFRASIILARSIGVPLIMLHATIGIAYLLARTGDVAQAIELLHLVIAHQACDEDPRTRAHALLDELVAPLPSEQRSMRPNCTLDEALAKVLGTSLDDMLSS